MQSGSADQQAQTRCHVVLVTSRDHYDRTYQKDSEDIGNQEMGFIGL